MLLLVFYPFFPESPYWLIKKGRVEDARKSLLRIHGRDDPVLIDAEVARIQGMVNFSEELKSQAAQKGIPVLQCLQGRNLVGYNPPLRVHV